MNVRVRKLIGTVLLVGFVCVYALTIMVIASAVLPGRGHLTQILYFAITGLIWVVPAGLIIRWMERPRA